MKDGQTPFSLQRQAGNWKINMTDTQLTNQFARSIAAQALKDFFEVIDKIGMSAQEFEDEHNISPCDMAELVSTMALSFLVNATMRISEDTREPFLKEIETMFADLPAIVAQAEAQNPYNNETNYDPGNA